MATITLITEQHGIDKEGNHWVLTHQDPNEWQISKEWNEVQDTSQE
jgi:hypothetical protein